MLAFIFFFRQAKVKSYSPLWQKSSVQIEHYRIMKRRKSYWVKCEH